MLKIHIPAKSGIYKIAAEEFVSLWQKVTGKRLAITTKDDKKSNLIVLGSDAVNSFAHEKIIEKVIPQFRVRTNTDDYQLVSAKDGKRELLFLAGGRPRAILYAVYHYFESVANCRYFWDGDIVPECSTPQLSGIDILERPRFEYRGLRYFAHRSLNRFQAEHWDFEEWKQEIDWILKKRLNMFMLRIGLDDMFQKAFPEIVSYPGYQVPESLPRSYNDRDLFWSLKYRGELRKKVLAYARERDLLHPEDLGTMTHWYSRTPQEFLDKVKPDFMPQATRAYNEQTGMVWDIRKDENLDNYFKLTETHIKEYGSPDLFHTIGLAERRCYADHDSNHQMKLYAYRRIIGKLREKYPNAPLMIASWDFCMYWTPQEVRSLLKELNPANTLILEYSSDTTDEVNNFMNWELVGHFPWIFGIFHAFEPATEIRGNYDQIERRLPVAAEDPLCKGLVYWPECSHTDTLMLEFMSAMAWDPSQAKIDDFLPGFCKQRYANRTAEMLAIWQKLLPLAKLSGWAGPQEKNPSLTFFSELVFFLWDRLTILDANMLGRHLDQKMRYEEKVAVVPEILRMLIPIVKGEIDDFMRRDVIDLARTALSRLQTYGFSKYLLALEDWRNNIGSAKRVQDLLKYLCRTVELEADLIAAHEDYSLFDSLKMLEAKHETNPDFEKTLKSNAEAGYCRSYISELFTGIYLPDLKAYSRWINSKINANDRAPLTKIPECEVWKKEIQEKFHATPLAEMAPDHAVAFRNLPKTLEKLAAEAEKVLR